MRNKGKKAAKRMLYNWRHIEDTTYAEAYFMGMWGALTDDQAVWVLRHLTKDEMNLIVKSYPLWM